MSIVLSKTVWIIIRLFLTNGSFKSFILVSRWQFRDKNLHLAREKCKLIARAGPTDADSTLFTRLITESPLSEVVLAQVGLLIYNDTLSLKFS